MFDVGIGGGSDSVEAGLTVPRSVRNGSPAPLVNEDAGLGAPVLLWAWHSDDRKKNNKIALVTILNIKSMILSILNSSSMNETEELQSDCRQM